jgi:hypothetical protein
MRKAMLEKSNERPQPKTTEPPVAAKADEKSKPISKIVKSEKEQSKVLDPEEKKKEIFKKYGLKDRTPIVIQAISDDSDYSNDSDDEVDMKKLTDKELAEKYGLPYFEVTEEKDIERSDSTAGFSSLLSKIRQAQSEKSQSITQTKQIFEQNKTGNYVYESLSPTNSRSSSPFPNYEPGNIVIARMKKLFEDKTPDRRSFISDESNSRCNSPLAFNDEIARSGSTTRMKQMFEAASPTN